MLVLKRGFSSIKFDYSDCPKSYLISRINEVYVFFLKKMSLYRDIFFIEKKKLHL